MINELMGNRPDMDMDEMDDQQLMDSDTMERYLTFVSDGLIYAVSTEYVTEIITNHTITMLPMVPHFISGIINLRGQIIPILDIRARMNKTPADYQNGSCIIVLNINTVNVGIIIDSVSQVVDVDKAQISSMPANSHQELVNGMISIPGEQVILFLDCNLLVNNNY